MRATRPLLAAVALSVAACDEPTSPTIPFGPDAGAESGAPSGQFAELTVMTRNMYVGADVDAVIAALATPDLADDQAALITAIGTLHQTDFPARAGAMADEIARARPHVVGLQEVSRLDVSLPPLGVEVHLDFLPMLLGELAARGLRYEVAAKVRNIETTPFPGVGLIDEDAILVDAERVAVGATTSRTFAANLGEVAPGVVLARGWVSASVTVGGRTYHVASTHFEAGSFPGLDQLRAAQAAELVQSLPGGSPTIVMGDLNDIPGSPMYQVLVGAGFNDVWRALRGAAAGYTCCHLYDLSNPVQQFDERIDFVFARLAAGDELKGRIDRVGDQPSDSVPGPVHRIWPSDHAGLVARLITHLLSS